MSFFSICFVTLTSHCGRASAGCSPCLGLPWWGPCHLHLGLHQLFSMVRRRLLQMMKLFSHLLLLTQQLPLVAESPLGALLYVLRLTSLLWTSWRSSSWLAASSYHLWRSRATLSVVADPRGVLAVIASSLHPAVPLLLHCQTSYLISSLLGQTLSRTWKLKFNSDLYMYETCTS